MKKSNKIQRKCYRIQCKFHKSTFCSSVELHKLTGEKLFKEIQKIFGGKRIWIPKTGHSFSCKYCEDRNTHILKLYRRGASIKWLAKKFDLSNKRV